MKKRLLTIVILLVLFLTACAGRTAGADDAERLPAESVTMLDEGVWPVNAYTEGLPVPPGTVTWAMLDAEHDTCGVSAVFPGGSADRSSQMEASDGRGG